MPTNYKNIPEELRALGAVFALGNTNKNPVCRDYKLTWSDKSIHMTFDEAAQKLSKTYPYIGIFVKDPEVIAAGYCFIDLDGKGHKKPKEISLTDEEWGALVQEWDNDLQRVKRGDFSRGGKFSDMITAADTYAEISLSGNGAHIIYKGEKINVNEPGNIETTNKFIILTGYTIPQHNKINVIKDTSALESAAKRHTLKAPETAHAQSVTASPSFPHSAPSDSDRGSPDLYAVSGACVHFLDTTLIPSKGKDMKICPLCRSGLGPNGTGAFHVIERGGGWIGKIGTCQIPNCILHKGGDEIQITFAIKHGWLPPSLKEDSRTYLECAKVLSKDFNIPLQSSAAIDFKEPIDETELLQAFPEIIVTETQAPLPDIKPIFDYLPEISAYLSDSERRRPFKTGFADLDEALGGGLYPEQVTLIGAVPSLGKTTFALQIADNVARSGKPVVYFALEMSQAELFARSVSRISYEHDSENALTQLDVMNLFNKPERLGKPKFDNLRGAADEYTRDISHKLYIIERRQNAQPNTDKRLSVFDIQSITKQVLQKEGQRPLVVIDYFQIMRPHTNTTQEYDVLKCAATTLKELARELKLHILVISSFNRNNYDLKANYAAFKGTGELEYSADNVIGMQAAGAGEQGFDINREKRKDPRNIELVLLKTRAVKTGETYKVDYYPAYNYFVCDGIKTEDEYNTDNYTSSVNSRLQRNADNWRSRLETLRAAFDFVSGGYGGSGTADFDEVKKFMHVTAPTLKAWLSDFDDHFGYDPKTKVITVIRKQDDRPEDVRETEESIKELIDPKRRKNRLKGL